MNINITNKNIKYNGDRRYINQDEYNKLNDYEKFFGPCKCGKKTESRWREENNDGIFHAICAFKGSNNEELCCKCVEKNTCQKCGRQENLIAQHKKGSTHEFGMLEDFEKDYNNPSGGYWVYSCVGCNPKRFNEFKNIHSQMIKWGIKEIKPGLSKKEVSELNQNANKPENTTDKPPMSAEHFIFDANTGEIKSQENDKGDKGFVENGDKNKDVIQPVKIIVDKGNNSESNSPPNCQETPPNQENKEMLVIDLRVIKKIELTEDGKLVIEFNGPENSNYTLSQTITAEQVNSSQELQTIKNYCQKNGKNSLSQSELNNVFNTHNSTLGSTDKPTGNNNALTIGLSVAAALIVGLALGLLFKRKKRVKRS